MGGYARVASRPIYCQNSSYLGNDRIVPHAEKSVSRSYKRLFQPATAAGWEDQAREIVGRILRQEYTDFEYRKHSKYSLPVASKNATT
jgi:hypothetical protein